MELIQQIKLDGARNGMCRLFQTRLKPGLDTKDLADMYFKGMDFCIGRDFPTLEFMRENFKGTGEMYGVYIDSDNVSTRNPKRAVLIGDSNVKMTFDGFSVSRVFVRHGSMATIRVSGYANLSVDAFDNARIYVDVIGSKAKVIVDTYGDARAVCAGMAKISHKQKY